MLRAQRVYGKTVQMEIQVPSEKIYRCQRWVWVGQKKIRILFCGKIVRSRPDLPAACEIHHFSLYWLLARKNFLWGSVFHGKKLHKRISFKEQFGACEIRQLFFDWICLMCSSIFIQKLIASSLCAWSSNFRMPALTAALLSCTGTFLIDTLWFLSGSRLLFISTKRISRSIVQFNVSL